MHGGSWLQSAVATSQKRPCLLGGTWLHLHELVGQVPDLLLPELGEVDDCAQRATQARRVGLEEVLCATQGRSEAACVCVSALAVRSCPWRTSLMACRNTLYKATQATLWCAALSPPAMAGLNMFTLVEEEKKACGHRSR